MTETTIAIIVAVGGPVIAYLAAAKQFSGKISSSDATDLWTESRSIRDWSQARILSLEKRITALERVNRDYGRENASLKVRVREMAETIRSLQAQIVKLTRQLKEAQQRVRRQDGGADAQP